MALLDEMRTLVGDLETAFSRRLEDEHERQETAAKDARERMGAERKRRAAGADDARERARGDRKRRDDAARDARDRASEARDRHGSAEREARERLAEISVRYNAVADTVEAFRRERLAQTAEDARDRVQAERTRRAAGARDARERSSEDHERRAIAAHEAHERLAEVVELGNIWGVHTATIGGLGGQGFRITARTPAGRVPGEPEPAAVAAKPPAAKKPARAGKAARGGKAGRAAKRAPASPAAISSYLADHPDGVKLAELEGQFGSSRSVLVRILKEMVAGNAARREGKSRLYFAA